jgi:hypothetical protein
VNTVAGLFGISDGRYPQGPISLGLLELVMRRRLPYLFAIIDLRAFPASLAPHLDDRYQELQSSVFPTCHLWKTLASNAATSITCFVLDFSFYPTGNGVELLNFVVLLANVGPRHLPLYPKFQCDPYLVFAKHGYQKL